MHKKCIETIWSGRDTMEREMSAIDTIGARSIGSREQGAYSLPKVIVWLEYMLERRRSRLALLEMSDDQLKDIGVSRGEAYGEASRAFWE
jgi:uncharacterized protein YjiS (DUF1127 family)